MPRCPECATEYTGEEGCPTCGASPAAHRCEHCGEEFGDADACPACGRAREPFACADHPDREAQGRCVVCGKALCDECQHEKSRAMLCADHDGVTVIEGWAQIYSTTREFDAQLLRDNIQAEGIEARIFSQRDNMISLDLGEFSIVRLLVPVWEYERAVQLIRSHTNESGEVAFACPECGEAYDPGAGNCATCGAVIT